MWWPSVHLAPQERTLVALFLLAFLLGGLTLWLRSCNSPVRVIQAGEETAAPPDPAETQEAQLYVHVAGAVAAPGVYALAPDARVVAALEAAGGASPDADLAVLNLAAPLKDADKIYVPRQGELREWERVQQLQTTTATQIWEQSPPPSSPAVPGKVNLNQATSEELETLPGIGPALAQRIIKFREEHGPFTNIEELLEVSGIGSKILARLRSLITL